MPPRLLFDLQGKRVFVAGHKGLAGSALLKALGARRLRDPHRRFDTTRPDGTPRKPLDVSRLHALGWCANTPLRQGRSRRRFSFRRRPPGRVTGPDGKLPRARLRFLSGLRRTSALTVRGTNSVQTALSRAERAQ